MKEKKAEVEIENKNPKLLSGTIKSKKCFVCI